MPKAHTYWPYTKAKRFAIKLGLRSSRRWRDYTAGRLPDLPQIPVEVPKHPEKAYTEWKGWEEWLGESFEGKREYVDYKKAKAFAQKLKLGSISQWRKHCKGELSGKKLPKVPKNIPTDPYIVYKKEFEGWAIFLGNPHKKRKTYFRPFEEARSFAIKLGLNGGRQWKRYCNGEMPHLPKLPNDISSAPHMYYKEWKSWPYFLGNPERNYVSYDKAKGAALKNGIKTQKQWRAFVGKKLPLSKMDLSLILPKSPDKIYKITGDWKGWGEFTGQPEKKPQRNVAIISYAKAKAFVIPLKLKNKREWFKYIKGEFPHLPKLIPGIPKSPISTYKIKEQSAGWGDFLGTGNVASVNKEFWSFERARTYVHRLKLNSVKEWCLYTKRKLVGKEVMPKNLPKEPRYVYKEKWKGYSDFLGTGRSWKKKS